MQNPHSEILLISIDAEPTGKHHSLRHFGGHFAPLGLYCLAATAPDRIAVLISNDNAQFLDSLSAFKNIRAIILQIRKNTADDKITRVVAQLRKQFPGVRIGANKQALLPQDLFDFSISGTGKTSILRILRGELPGNDFDQQTNEHFSTLDIPGEPLEEGDFEAGPAKWLVGRTIEIFQPWLGLLEQTGQYNCWPGIEWIARFMTWLKSSGYSAVHFRPSGLNPDQLHELRSVMLNLKLHFSVGFNVSDRLRFSCVGHPLRQIWLYQQNPATADICLEKLAQIKEAGCQPCLQLSYDSCDISTETSLLAAAARLDIKNLHDWPISDIKRITAKFWRRRFFPRLFGLRSAAELIMFMKTSYNILDITLSSERH